MSTRSTATLKLIVPLAFTGLVAAACGSSGSGNAAGGNTQPTPAQQAPRASNQITVDEHSGAAGTFLTDSRGRSLYLFTSDTAHRSSCAGGCLSVWPPLTTTAGVHAGSGVTASAISTIPAAGGKRQVEYHGHPLYLYAGDHSAGQTNGQGSQDFGASWWLVSPSGAELTAPARSGASSSHGGSGGGGYWG